MNGQVCDFCSGPEIRWDYPATTFEIPTPAELPVGLTSVDGWAACDACAALIDAGDRAGLAVRTVEAYPESIRDIASDEDLLASAVEVQAGFFRQRTGPPIPYRAGVTK